MTRKESKTKNINSVPDEGTESKKWNHKKSPRNKNETHATNYAKQQAYKDLLGVRGIYNFWLKDFKAELHSMNCNKVGRPFQYTDTFIYWILILFGLGNKDYTEIQGEIDTKIEWIMVSEYAKYLPEGFVGPDYTTIFRRFTRIMSVVAFKKGDMDPRVMCVIVKKTVSDRVLTCAVDSTALNLSNTNLWRKTKWKTGPIYRGWIKIHALVDVDTNEIIAVIVTTDKMGDNTAFTMLTDLAFDKGHKISTIYADSAYEAKSNWKDSEAKKYTLVVKFKKNCNGKCNGSFARGKAAKEYLDMSYDEWRATTKYGRRWKAESSFSDFKRLISEHIASVSDQGIIKETAAKILGYNFFKATRAKMVHRTSNGVIVS